MSTENANEVYKVIDPVLNEETKVINKQFVKTAQRYGVTVDELRVSYVSSKGKRALKELNLTLEEVKTQFPTINDKVLARLRVYKTERKARQPKPVESPVIAEEPVSETPTETPVEPISEIVETPVDNPEEVVFVGEVEEIG
jgi:hypothetical protein